MSPQLPSEEDAISEATIPSSAFRDLLEHFNTTLNTKDTSTKQRMAKTDLILVWRFDEDGVEVSTRGHWRDGSSKSSSLAQRAPEKDLCA